MSTTNAPLNTSPSPFRSIVFIAGILLFGMAFLFKWMKWPTGSMQLVLASMVTLVSAFIGRHNSEYGRRLQILMRLTVGTAMAYIVFRLLYWPGSAVILMAAFTTTVFALLAWNHRARPWRGSLAAMLFAMVIVGALSILPTHALYGYMNLETPGAQRYRHSGCGQWYRYSWMLYNEGLYAESLAMNDSAQAVVRMHHERTGSDGTWLIEKLEHTHAAIEARTWDHFAELDADRKAQ